MRSSILAVAALAAACYFGELSEAQAQIYFGNGRISVGIGVGGGYGSRGYGYGNYGSRGYGYGNYGYRDYGYRSYGYPYGGFGYGPGLGGIYGNNMVPGYPYYGTGRPSYSYRSTPSPRRTVIISPRSTPPREGAGLPIKITSPADAGATLAYSLNQYEYVIQPGESQMLTNDREWIITFDRGGDFGTARYTLFPGSYEFALTEKGWEIYHDADVSKLMPKSEGEKTTPKNPLPSTDKTP